MPIGKTNASTDGDGNFYQCVFYFCGCIDSRVYRSFILEKKYIYIQIIVPVIYFWRHITMP